MSEVPSMEESPFNLSPRFMLAALREIEVMYFIAKGRKDDFPSVASNTLVEVHIYNDKVVLDYLKKPENTCRASLCFTVVEARAIRWAFRSESASNNTKIASECGVILCSTK